MPKVMMKPDTNGTLPDSGTVFTHIAHALARGYTDLYYVNMDTDEFIEFHTDDERGVLAEARRGTDFFVHISQLMGKVSDHNAAAREGGIVIACGMARFENDGCVAPVFERADQSMYENKAKLKAGQA